jgi:transketolase
MRKAFIQTVMEMAGKDDRIVIIAPDIGFSVFEPFMNAFPGRFWNTGISEQNSMGLAAGLALSGYLPIVYSIIPFVTLRCYEQVKVDVAFQKAHVTIVGVGGGLAYGPAGPTHHAIEDIAAMRVLPGMTIVCPGDPLEAAQLIRQAIELPGPCYVRLGRGGEPIIHAPGDQVVLGRGFELISGTDGTLITTSNMLETGKRWVEELSTVGVKASLISMHTVKPIDADLVRGIIRHGSPIATLEEHNIIGGLGSAVAEIIAESGISVPFRRFGINDVFVDAVGSQNYLRRACGLDRPDLAFFKGRG